MKDMISTFDDYAIKSSRTMNDSLFYDEKMSMLSMGLSGESGELASLLIEFLSVDFSNNKKIDDLIKKEIGDVFWYASNLLNELDVSIDSIITERYNINQGLVGYQYFDEVSERCYIDRIHNHLHEFLGDVSSNIKRVISSQSILFESSSLVLDHVKKHVFHNHKIDLDLISKETEKIISELCFICENREYDVCEVLMMNIIKLEKRYPKGFSSEKSINRED